MKSASFWPISSSDFMPQHKSLLGSEEIYPHYIIISFSRCFLYLAGSLTCLTRHGHPRTPTSTCTFSKDFFSLLIQMDLVLMTAGRSASYTNTASIYDAHRPSLSLSLSDSRPCCIGRRLLSKSGRPPGCVHAFWLEEETVPLTEHGAPPAKTNLFQSLPICFSHWSVWHESSCLQSTSFK